MNRFRLPAAGILVSFVIRFRNDGLKRYGLDDNWRSASGSYAKASVTACGLCLPSAAKGLPTALRVVATAKQGEKVRSNLSDGKAGSPRLCLGNMVQGFTQGLIPFILSC
jgi:hypothetical protein